MSTTVIPGVQEGGLLGACPACSLPLPLRHPQRGEQGRDWVCAGCGALRHGVLLSNWPAEFQRNVSPATSQVPPDEPSSPLDRPTVPAPPARVDRPEALTQAIPDHPSVPCELETEFSRGLDMKIRRGLNLKAACQGKPFALDVRRHGAVAYSKELTNSLLVLLRNSAEAATDVFMSLASEMAPNLDLAESITKDGLSGAAEDFDLFVYLGCAPCSAGYPSKHALQTAMLAMCIGVSMGWDEQTLLDLGMGCLLHDVGMLGVEQSIRHSKVTLSLSDFKQITRHPLYTIQWLRRHFGQIPAAAQMICYQMHERCNGTGYPRGYTGDQIHDLAKVAAVADVFVALVSPRPHRPGMVPYHALKKILQDTKEGFYDPAAVRGLLNTVSLFPIGSRVAFNDGRVGRVIRTTGETYDRPIVEVWKHQDPSTEHSVIDLTRAEGLKIRAALVGANP